MTDDTPPNPTRIGLKETTIKQIVDVFAKYPAIEKAILYGSRARGNHRNGSDIDLTFVGDALDSHVLGRVSFELDDLLLPYSFDLSLLREISHPDFLYHIEQVGVVFYERDKECCTTVDDVGLSPFR